MDKIFRQLIEQVDKASSIESFQQTLSETTHQEFSQHDYLSRLLTDIFSSEADNPVLKNPSLQDKLIKLLTDIYSRHTSQDKAVFVRRLTEVFTSSTDNPHQQLTLNLLLSLEQQGMIVSRNLFTSAICSLEKSITLRETLDAIEHAIIDTAKQTSSIQSFWFYHAISARYEKTLRYEHNHYFELFAQSAFSFIRRSLFYFSLDSQTELSHSALTTLANSDWHHFFSQEDYITLVTYRKWLLPEQQPFLDGLIKHLQRKQLPAVTIKREKAWVDQLTATPLRSDGSLYLEVTLFFNKEYQTFQLIFDQQAGINFGAIRAASLKPGKTEKAKSTTRLRTINKEKLTPLLNHFLHRSIVNKCPVPPLLLFLYESLQADWLYPIQLKLNDLHAYLNRMSHHKTGTETIYNMYQHWFVHDPHPSVTSVMDLFKKEFYTNRKLWHERLILSGWMFAQQLKDLEHITQAVISLGRPKDMSADPLLSQIAVLSLSDKLLKQEQPETTEKSPTPGRAVYRILITLNSTSPPVTRTLELMNTTSLKLLATLIAASFDWPASQNSEFRTDEITSAPIKSKQLRHLLSHEEQSILFVVEMANIWQLTISLDTVLPPKRHNQPAKLLDVTGISPPESIASPQEYQRMADALNNPSHQHHNQWLRRLKLDADEVKKFCNPTITKLNQQLEQIQHSEKANV